MQKLACGALFIGLLVACGSSSKVTIVDAAGSGGGSACNVLAQTGCPTGERCTWVQDTMTVGHIDCEAAGTVPLGGDCMFGSDGTTTGFDNCEQGNICISGKCEQICDNNGGAPMCASGFACGLYTGLFEVNGNFDAGACDKTCDPFADNSFGSGGSGDVIPPKTGTTCGSGQGCYGFPSTTTDPTHFTCSSEVNTNLVNRSDCSSPDCAPDASSVYLNGCAQGYVPALNDGAVGSTQAICSAFCSPQNCFMGSCGSDGFAAKGSGAHACSLTAMRNDSTYTTFVENSAQNSCFYSWVFEIDMNGSDHPSPTSDTLGFCLDHSKYKVDSNNNGQIDGSDANMPNCSALPGSGSGIYGLDAPSQGCTDSAHAMAEGDLFQDGHMKAQRLEDLPRFPEAVLAQRHR